MTESPGRLAGRTAFITGAASGIGSAAARLFAAEGATVIVCDIDDPAEVVDQITDAGGHAIPAQCDVADAGQVRDVATKLLEQVSLVDVLFNNAGTLAGDAAAHLLEPDAAEHVVAVNLLGMMHTCRYFLPAMVEAGVGSIVSTSSVGGLVGVISNHAYCASKGGVIAYTRALAVTYGKNGIRANVICPGPTRTGMSAGLGAEKWERTRSAEVPLARVAMPQEIARAALFLASDDASYVTGAVIPVDGGRTAA